jgi:hypothetical protein
LRHDPETEGLAVAGKTVDAYVAALRPAQRHIVEEIRKIVHSAAPEATEAYKWAEPVFESNGPFAWVKAHSNHVTFGFWRGVELDAGRGVLETSGSKMAHVKLRDVSDIDRSALTTLVRDAVRLNREKGDPTRA